MLDSIATNKVEAGQSFLDFKKDCSTKEFPTAFANYVKGKGDVYFWPSGNFHVVTNLGLAKQVLRSSSFSADRGGFFISRMPNMDLSLIKDFFGVVQKMMVMSDGKEHARRRGAATLGLEDQILDHFENKVRETIGALLENAFSRPEVEFVEEIAKKLPSTVLADLFCIPETDRQNFFEWSNIMTAFFGGATSYENKYGIKVNQAAVALKNYFQGLIDERRDTPGEDYISNLLKAQEVFELSDEEVISQAVMMLVAGQVTTTDQICNIMYFLASKPELQAELRTHPELLPNAIEEMKRFDPAVTFLFRVAKEDTYLDTQFIHKGETVFVSNHAVNRPDSMPHPNELDIHRKNVQHFAYGHGPHYCIGARLGRMQMNLLFSELLKRIPTFQIHQEKGAQRDHYSLSFSGFKTINLVVKQ